MHAFVTKFLPLQDRQSLVLAGEHLVEVALNHCHRCSCHLRQHKILSFFSPSPLIIFMNCQQRTEKFLHKKFSMPVLIRAFVLALNSQKKSSRLKLHTYTRSALLNPVKHLHKPCEGWLPKSRVTEYQV